MLSNFTRFYSNYIFHLMKLHIGPPPHNPNFSPEKDDWRKFKEPGAILMQVLALPIGLILAGFVAYTWLKLAPTQPSLNSLNLLLLFILLIPIHEFIHLLVHPKAGWTKSSIAGVWPSRLLFYAHFIDPLPRNRLLAILIAPLIVLSMLPFLVCISLSVDSSTLFLFSVLNAVCACGDVFACLLILFQVPSRSQICNQGYWSYWKPDSSMAT